MRRSRERCRTVARKEATVLLKRRHIADVSLPTQILSTGDVVVSRKFKWE